MEFNKQHLVLLFERPKEPYFVPKGIKKILFRAGALFLNEKYQSRSEDLYNIYAKESKEEYHVKDIDPPDLELICQLSRMENFSVFIRKHTELAGKLVKLFMDASDLHDLLAKGIYSRERVNPYLFNYAWACCLLHRPDTRDIRVPSLITSFPDKLIPNSVLEKAREETELIPASKREVIDLPSEFTASRGEPEHRLAYFREDLGINLHHWHWHLVYPNSGLESQVRKDRRGELFYYMHRQMVARYNFERLCNKLKRVDRLIDFRRPINHGYFSKLTSKIAGKEWPGRTAFQTMHNVNRPEGRYDLNDIERWRDRIYTAIHLGYYIGENGEHVSLEQDTGIDVLGNMVESSIISPNEGYYGDMHNKGHIIISAIHDPEYSHLEEFGVMGDTATAVRDPVFFKWHAFLDDTFQEYKKTLPPYKTHELVYEDILVTSVSVGKDNTLYTHWKQSEVDVNHGLDFTPRGPTKIRFKHLTHEPFSYAIKVMNNANECFGTCRIFMSPKYDESGHTWLFDDQRLMMIELDRFKVKLNRGLNTIKRKSADSSVTIPFDRIFTGIDESNIDPEENFCSCGWPEYMLIPKGTTKGYPCELFVMISNYEDDKINEDGERCKDDASSYCGVRDGKYPDKRPMGYPFDRLTSIIEGTLKEFLKKNMHVQDIFIQLKGEDYITDTV